MWRLPHTCATCDPHLGVFIVYVLLCIVEAHQLLLVLHATEALRTNNEEENVWEYVGLQP